MELIGCHHWPLGHAACHLPVEVIEAIDDVQAGCHGITGGSPSVWLINVKVSQFRAEVPENILNWLFLTMKLR